MQIEVNQTGYIVVSPFGNDKCARRESFNRSFGTISAALKAVQPNDTVLVYGDDNHEYQETPIDTQEHPGKQAWDFAYKGAPLYVDTKDNVTLRGIGWPKVRFTKHGNGFSLTTCRNFTMTGMQFAGQGYITEKGKSRYYALFLFDGVNDGHNIEGNIFMDSGDHLLAHLYGPRSIFNTRVANNKFYRNGNLAVGEPWHDGVAIGLGGYGNQIVGNYGEENNRFIEIESGQFQERDASAPAHRILVADNVGYHIWWQGIITTPIHGKADLYQQIIYRGNHLQGWGAQPNTPGGPAMPGGGTWGQMGFWLTGGRNQIYEGNIVTDMWDGCGFTVEAVNCDITGIQFNNNQTLRTGRTGIHLVSDYQGNGFKLSRCQVNSNRIQGSKGVGIWVNGDLVQVHDNHIEDTDYEGLYHEGGAKNSFCMNTLTDCGGVGIWPKDARMSGPTWIQPTLETADLHNMIHWEKKQGVQPKAA